MFVKLLPNQIPSLWEQIKFAIVSADRIEEGARESYLINTLHALLSDQAQCYVRVDEQRLLQAVVITRFIKDEMTGDRTLLIQSLYSFQTVPEDIWITDMNTVEALAINSGCKKIMAYSNNERVFALAGRLNFNERFRCFVKEV